MPRLKPKKEKSIISIKWFSAYIWLQAAAKSLPMADVLKAGIISFGLSGRVFHAPFLLTNPKYKLVAVYERSKTESQSFAAKYGISIDLVRSVSELVNRSDIDIIIVCSPIEFHYDYAKLALLAGKNVLVEKAFCSTSKQAEDLMRIATESNLICCPYQNRRYDSDFLTIQRIIGQMGRLVEYNGYYNRYSPKVREGNWKDTVLGSGGNFLSLGSHMIDQAVALFGTPDRIWADVRAQRRGAILDDDAWEVHLYYDFSRNNLPNVTDFGSNNGKVKVEKGFKAILKGSLMCPDNSLRYMIHGENGSWYKTGVDMQESQLMMGLLPNYYSLTEIINNKNTASTDVATTLSASNQYSEPESQWGILTTVTTTGSNGAFSTVRSLTPPELGSYHYLYDEVYDSIVHSKASTISIEQAVAVLKIIELARQSSSEGKVLDFTLNSTTSL